MSQLFETIPFFTLLCSWKQLQPSSSNINVFCVRYNPASMDTSVHCVKIIRLQVQSGRMQNNQNNPKVVSGNYNLLNYLN